MLIATCSYKDGLFKPNIKPRKAFTDLTYLNITSIPKLSFIGMQGAPSYYNVHLKDDFLLSLSLFTERENEILPYIVQGMSSE